MSEVARSEARLLDLDLREIYRDYGSDSLYVLKKDVKGSPKDELYDYYREENYFMPYKVLGVVNSNPVKEVKVTEIGKETNTSKYKIKILKSSLQEQGVNNLTTLDKIMYNDMELTIISVRPHPMLGDYFVQYEVLAEGESLVPLLEDEGDEL